MYDSNNCAICLEGLFNPFLCICGHIYCKDCIQKWKTRSGMCPLCQAPIAEQTSQDAKNYTKAKALAIRQTTASAVGAASTNYSGTTSIPVAQNVGVLPVYTPQRNTPHKHFLGLRRMCRRVFRRRGQV